MLYVDWDEAENTADVTVLPLDEDGSFLEPWPQGFFAERYDEIFGEQDAPIALPFADEDELP